MKKTSLMFLIATFVICNLSFAQEQKEGEIRTLFGNNDKISHGGYGALLINYSQFEDKDVILVGGRGGWIINHGIAIGLGGYGFANQIAYDDLQIGGQTYDDYFLSGGYGGLLIEPILFPHQPVHVALPILIGGGGAAYVNNGWYDYQGDDWDYYTIDSSPFFVVEPGIEIEFNMVKFMRIGLGAYYRYTSGLNLVKTDEHVLDGFSTGLSLKFGKF
ncbi:MAG: hypothetical protein IH598_08570 [Bacteroidales bacterium]|nr:hypothetical protein [Bacteroidales bacterium]